MTGKQQETQSQFNARADDAARSLRQQLIERGAQIPESRTVEVGPDGQPPAPLPPEGSYMRQQMEALAQQQHAEQQRAEQLAQAPLEQVTNGQPVAQPEVQAPQEPVEQQVSGNAQRRISELTTSLRAADQERQQAIAESQKTQETVAQLQAKLDAMEQQHRQLIEQNLDNLDPETRMQVMQDARLQELLSGFEQRIMGQIQPKLESVLNDRVQRAKEDLADKYSDVFDMGVHGPLIDMFREQNPACTIEQAFCAVAAEELLNRSTASAAAVPPIVHPGQGVSPRFAPEQPEQQSNPDQELAEEAARIKQLMRSSDPNDHRIGKQLALENIRKRYAHKNLG